MNQLVNKLMLITKKSLKLYVVSLLLTPYAKILGLVRNIQEKRDRDLSILVLPPADFGSLGDEAMITGLIEHFREEGVNRFGLISLPLSPNWDKFSSNIQNLEICHYSLYHPWRKWLDFLHIVSSYDRFYCLGADVMDGKYNEEASLHRLKYASLAAQTGAETAILGFSFNEQPIYSIIQAFQKLPSKVKLKARDPVSHNRLVKSLTRPVELVADIAFLMSPANHTHALSDVWKWIEQQKSDNRIVIGLNANSLVLPKRDKQSINKFVQIYINTLAEIKSAYKNSSFVLIPHDFRDAENDGSDIALLNLIWEFLPLNIKKDCIKVPTPFTAREIKFIAGNLDLVFSGRMHFAIACLGQGTPAICMSYQGKFEGLFKHFDLEEMLISAEKGFQDNTLSKFIIPLIDKRKETRVYIQQRLTKIRQLALANFE